MLLKPKLSNNIGMVIGGAIITVIVLSAFDVVDGYWRIIPNIFGVLGLLLFFVGIIAIVRRNKMAIIINESGIEVPAFNIFQKEPQRILIPLDELLLVAKHESIKGRLIEITTKDQNKLIVQARHYCELDEFISYCREQGLPVA
ncbi:MAG: hypothetical protein ABIK92_03505 [Pseudomonadota bacterium]